MFQRCIICILQLLLASSTTTSLSVKPIESSGNYLQKVINELQEFNTPISYPTIYSPMNSLAGKRLSASNSNFLPVTTRYHDNISRQTNVMNTAETEFQYNHQISAPVMSSNPSQILGKPVSFTRNQLATMYKQALESGNKMSLSSLKNTLDAQSSPSVISSQIHIPFPNQQLYTYQFYPLQSFIDELRDNSGYQIFEEFNPHPIAAPQNTSKEIIINPLFMAVSGFMGMALLFMFTVIFLPRIFGEFKSRVVHDEFLNLTETVTEAIDNYNSTTIRPKTTRYRGTAVGIKTRPVLGVRGAAKRKKKIPRPGEETT